jgi:DegV family protein with EDD domain
MKTLVRNSASLDAINVFPVPDGDTGMNMASTALAVVDSLDTCTVPSAGGVLHRAAESALEGARGNSGAILAQFFHGLAKELGQDVRISARRFAAAAMTAVEHTRSALSAPKEGTILTVLRDWAAELHARAQKTEDILDVFLSAFESAKKSLAATRTILPELRKAGVVDAGAKGFVHMLEGIVELVKTGGFRDIRKSRADFTASAVKQALLETGIGLTEVHDGESRYCAEAIIYGSDIDPGAVRAHLESMGESVVVAGGGDVVKVHVHSDHPDRVFDYVETLGMASGHKVDDILLQESLKSRSRRKCAIVVDTGCDLPSDFFLEQGIIKVSAVVSIRGKTRIDGPSLDIGRMHERMEREEGFLVSTSQPSETSFSRAFQSALVNADEALYIGLSSALSGTFQAGVMAGAAFGGQVRTFDSRTVTAGTGILVARAARLSEKGLRADEIIADLEKARERSIFLADIPDLRSLVRSGRISDLKGLVLQKLGVRPILSTDKAGKAKSVGLYFGPGQGTKKMASVIKSRFTRGQRAEIHIVHVRAEREAHELADMLSSFLEPVEKVLISDMGPLLASIAWLGSVAVAVVPD